MQSKVSDSVAEFLVQKNIRHAFGIIGSGNAHLFDSIAKRGFTEIVCVHHEQAAIMASITYYRTSGNLAAVLLTTGAGSTNGLTGVVSAWMDSMPCLILSGNENSKFTSEKNPLRIWGIQGYDSAGVVQKVTKHSSRVLDPDTIGEALETAYTIALSGRPGPCWVDIPMNVQAAQGQVPERVCKEITRPTVTGQITEGARRTLQLLSDAQRPLLWLGNGIRLAHAVDTVRPLLEKLRTPALVSWAGIDMIDSDHPYVFGRAGVYGQRGANFILQNSDLVVAIGTRMAMPQVGYDINELARRAKIVHVDIDPPETEKYRERVLGIVGDAGIFIHELLRTSSEFSLPSFEPWVKKCRDYQARYPWVGPEHADREGFINSYPFMERLNRHFKADQIVVTDMGTALLSGHQVLKFREGQRLLTSTGLGEMGFGLPGAIGASFATERGEVMCLNCDGGMMLNLQELQTVVHYGLPIKLFIFNNDGYLMIKHTQKALFQGRYAGTDKKSGVSCPNFTALAKAFEIPAFQIRTWEEADRILPQVQAATTPVICEVFMHPEQPLVPKLSLAPQKDGSIVSPPLEDLFPFLPRAELRENMLIGMHSKSEKIES